jgi:hypothetical protein
MTFAVKTVMIKRNLTLWLCLLISLSLSAQEKTFSTGGFIRGGAWFSTGDYNNDVNAALGDVSLTLTATDNLCYKGFADLRVRMGQQFGENTNKLEMREAWGMYYNNFMSLSLGKKIIKWGKTDIFTPLQRFTPFDFTYHSPDFADKDLGNIAGELVFTPASFIKLSAVATPFWYPSVLVTAPLDLPGNITLNIPEGLRTGNGYYSTGFRADFMLRGFDAGLQWYHGPDLMPGLSLTGADFTNPLNPSIAITGVPYIINQAGFDFETVLNPLILRGTISYSRPVRGKTGNEEIPFPQVEWVAGFDWTPGPVRMTVEYSGKKVLDFYDSPYPPLIGTELDMNELSQLMSTPGFDPVEFIRMQTEAFGRLYNNQLHEYYHMAGLRFEGDLMYGRLTPSLTTMYNFTSKDFMISPAIRFKPSDGVTLSAGMDFYSGPEGGLYDIIDDFMNSVFFAIQIDF